MTPLGDGIRLAVGTLTALPVPAPRRIDRAVARLAMLLAPAVGVLLGLLLGAATALGHAAGLLPFGGAVLGVAVLAVATRAVHLDGLADTFDALGSGHDRQRALAVARSGDSGPFGVVAVVLVLLLQVSSLAALAAREGAEELPSAALALLAGRAALTTACRSTVPAARPDGLGASVAGSVPRAAAVLVALAVVALGYAVARGPGALAGAAALLAGEGMRAVASRRLGGITGDVLGAVVEVASTAGLLVLVAVG